jgi:SAM-dependent methyltransferase
MDNYERLQRQYSKELKPCEICDSTDLLPFQRYGRTAEPGTYGEMPVTICGRCGFKMQNPRFEDRFYLDYYSELYRAVAFGSTKPSPEYVEQQKQRGASVLAWVKEHGVQPGVMLDHGCASGATMLAWRDAGWTVRGIDPHRPSVEAGLEMGLDIETAAGESLPFADETFDLILSLGSTEHAYDLKKTMCEAFRVLRPGATIVIRWRSNRIFGSPLEYYNHNHYRFFTPNTWRLCFARYGFAITGTTDRRLEGWDSYEYILARRLDAKAETAVEQLLAQGVRDDAEAELAMLDELRRGYYERCKAFLEFQNRSRALDPADLVQELRSGRAGFEWGLLGGQPADVLRRSRMEAERYIREYESGAVL